jgi:hypothetical protein
LRVRIAGEVKPQQVNGAKVAMQQERRASWTTVPFSNASPTDSSRDTIRVLQTSPRVPVERVEFVIAPSAVNFRREVDVRNENGNIIANGTITRIRIRRGKTAVEKDSMTVDIPSGTLSKRYEVTVHNGDDRPLPIQDIRLLSIQRRVYFNAPSDPALKLYYGDPKLTAPTYDYAKLFHREDAAVPATLGSGQHNPAYTGRPDDRPWTERHGWLLWAALIIAVLGLGAVAIRNVRTAV